MKLTTFVSDPINMRMLKNGSAGWPLLSRAVYCIILYLATRDAELQALLRAASPDSGTSDSSDSSNQS